MDAIEFFAANPRATAKEAGLTNAEANALVGRGLLIPAGARVTGKRGRPPMEYVVAGTDIGDSFAQEQVEEAVRIVQRHRHYERLSTQIMRASNQFGHGSEQHTDAVLLRRETYPELPALPTTGQYALAGVAVDDLSSPLDVPEDDDA